jgi:type II restriction/modification system DNA methylase subunit YeeA
MIEAEAFGIHREFPQVGPAAVKGIEINPYAAELARVTVWIGEIQWMRRNGFNVSRDPILKPLNTIECRDALLNPDGSEAEWPDADVIIGNPPFLGDKRMISVLGEHQVAAVRQAFKGRVPGGADLVAYWIDKGWRAVEKGHTQRAGLVARQSIRRGASNQPLKRIAAEGRIFNAWEDEPWVVEGAAVRVSIVCFEKGGYGGTLNGSAVSRVNADLSGLELDLAAAVRLPENRGACFQGPVKVGPFDLHGDEARALLAAPVNPNGRPNNDILRPWVNGLDIVRRPLDCAEASARPRSSTGVEPDKRHKQRVLDRVVQGVAAPEALKRDPCNRVESLSPVLMGRTESAPQIARPKPPKGISRSEGDHATIPPTSVPWHEDGCYSDHSDASQGVSSSGHERDGWSSWPS